MPAENQWAVSTLIREVLADPDLARRASSAACPRAELQDLVDAEAAAVIDAGRHERTSERTSRRNWIVLSVVEGLTPWRDEDHARTREAPR